MDRETLYKFFEGAASYEEEVRIRQWMEHSPENSLSSLGTTFFFKKYPFQPEPLFVIIHSLGNLQ